MSGESLKLVCIGCGASLEYSATDRALKCPYCSKVTDIPGSEEETPDTVRAIVPLTVDVTQLTDAVYRHLASGDMTPDHLLEHASITKKDRFYVPAFRFHGNFDATWTASFGYDRTEHYTEYESRHENGRTVRVPVNKSRTVTDWRPVNGTDTGKFAVFAYAGTRLLGSPLKLTNLVEGEALEAAPYDASYISGFTVEDFQHTESNIYSDRGETLVHNVINHSVQRHAQGDRQKDWHWTADIQRKSVTTLVPVCHAIYEFEGKQYNVWLSGSNTARIVADDLPIDNGRQHAVNIGYIPFGAATLGAAIAIFGMDSSWSIPLTAIAVSLLYGILRRKAIVSYSHKIRQALLKRRQTTNDAVASMGTTKVISKPWLAHTSYDKLFLPLITFVFIALPIGSAGIWRASSTDQQAVAQSQPLQNDGSATNSSGQVSNPPQNTAPTAVQTPLAGVDNSRSVTRSDVPTSNGTQPAPATAPQSEVQLESQPQSPTASAASAAPSDSGIASVTNLSSAHESSTPPSFNCQKAQSPTEIAICSDNNLSRLDAQMGRSYRETLDRASPDQLASIKTDQRQWLRNRDEQCAAQRACISEQLTSRIEQLKQAAPIASTEGHPRSSQLDQGKLEAANDCFKAANYDCSIQITRSLLEANPNDETAAQLLHRSREAQAQALQGNWNIH